MTTTDERPACGTYAAYQRHKYYGETPCGPCRQANNEYQREYRLTNTGYRADNAARHRALTRLANNHRAEFARLLDEEREATSP